MLWKQKNEPLFSQRKEFSGSHFLQLLARPWSLCSCIHNNHLTWFWRPVLTPLLVTSSNGSFAKEAGNAPGYRAPSVKAVLHQLTKYLEKMRADRKRIRLPTPLLTEAHPQFPAIRRSLSILLLCRSWA